VCPSDMEETMDDARADRPDREPREVQAAGAVVFRDQGDGPEYLLLRNSRHLTWAPPKGHLEPGETLEEGAGRELEEELGREAELKFLPGFREETVYEVDEGEGPRKKRVTYFLARLEGGRVRRSSEHDALVWAGIHTALAILQHKDLRKILRAAHKFLTGEEV